MHKDTPTLEDRVLAIKLRIAQFKAEHPGLYTSHTTTAHTSNHTSNTSTNTTTRTATTSIKDKLNSIRK